MKIFINGLVYGLYLTLTTWVLYHLLAKTEWMSHNIKAYSLDDRYYIRKNFCESKALPGRVRAGPHGHWAGPVGSREQPRGTRPKRIGDMPWVKASH